jgi:hypothetical protein
MNHYRALVRVDIEEKALICGEYRAVPKRTNALPWSSY